MRVQEIFDLSGRIALVTGGGRGLGRSMALGLAEAGADVVVAGRTIEACEQTAAAVEKRGRRGAALRADLSKLEDVEALVEAAAAFGHVDVLVNNAAVAWGAPVLEHPAKGWDKVFDLNVRGLFFLSQGVAKRMVEAGGGGSIIHISSIASFRGAADELEPSVAYTASKGAVNTLTRDMAIKLAPHGIRVNAIAPGPFDTDMLGHVTRDADTQRRFLERLPMHRVGGEDDIKGAVVFLASPAAAYVTGHILAVDGGWSAQTS